MKKITKVGFIQLTKLIFISVAYVCFTIHSFVAILDFKEEKTGLNQFLHPVKELPMPSITVCSQEIFRNITSETTVDVMLQNLEDYVYKRSDLFHETFFSLNTLNGEKVWHLHEIFSSQLGLCQSLRTDMKYDGGNSHNLVLRLPGSQKFKVWT